MRVPRIPAGPTSSRRLDVIWFGVLAAVVGWGAWVLVRHEASVLSWRDLGIAASNGGLTLFRVMILIALASLIWVPIGVFVGLSPKLAARVQPVAQFLAAFPANLLFPVVVFLIVRFHAEPKIWLSPLIILGAQWYILFNVIAGASAFPTDFRSGV